MSNFDISSELCRVSYNYLKAFECKDSFLFDSYIVLNDNSSVFFSNVTRDFLIEQYEHFEVYGVKQFYLNLSRRGD